MNYKIKNSQYSFSTVAKCYWGILMDEEKIPSLYFAERGIEAQSDWITSLIVELESILATENIFLNFVPSCFLGGGNEVWGKF